jgi:hypothetical protein
MADTNAQADIRGIDIDKLAKGFADEEIKLKRFVTNSNTSAREIRWYQKTSGFLNSVSTTGITASQIANTDFKSRPVVVEQSWTKNTSYVRKYFVESPWISDEDIRDTDIDILATNVRDLVRAVEHQVDLRIWSIISNGQNGVGINTNATTAPWDTASFTNIDIIEDLMEAKMNIRVDGYDPEGAILLVNSYDHKQILTWLISNKGSSIPAFASQKIETGVVMELLGLKVVVDENVTAGYALVFVNQRAATWKSFVPLTSVTIEDKDIGTKIRIWEEGECILTDPNAVNLITNTRT